MATIEGEGICVRAWDWSETSQTGVIFTRAHGVVRVLAKGSRRPGAPFSGGFELSTMGVLHAIVRPNSELALATRWDLIDPMPRVRASLEAYRVATLAIDLIPRMIQDHDPHPACYDALRRVLALGTDAGDRYPEIARFLWSVLDESGSAPELDLDVASGARLARADVYGFAPDLGGLTSDPGVEGDDRATRVWRVRARTLEIMRSMRDANGASFSDLGAEDTRRTAALLGAYTRERLGTDLPSMRWLIEG